MRKRKTKRKAKLRPDVGKPMVTAPRRVSLIDLSLITFAVVGLLIAFH